MLHAPVTYLNTDNKHQLFSFAVVDSEDGTM